ncbi:MAG: RluA family pseudouridine synthase [Phycisphaerales bacterium]|nr:RluA family pseudouridine synthase [Planctomycetota bacterium]MCH8507194.1 RluA family pseudouridine synthase [Phycisphaerales bacterium]
MTEGGVVGPDPGKPGEDAAAPLVQPGGKVDREAVRLAYERAREEGDEDFLARVRFELQRDLRTRLDKYLVTRVTFMSRSALQRLIDGGGATVNGRPAKASNKLRGGDVVELIIPPPPSGEIEPEDIPLEVIVEDEHLIVIDKPADIIVHPARSENMGTILNALAWRFSHVSGGGLSPVGEEFARPGVVHRLDRHTSGCIVFAKTEEAHWKLGRQFENRTVDKRYLAVVQGLVGPDTQVIDLPLGPHPSKAKGAREKRVVRHDDLGKPSVTICRVRERYRMDDSPGFTLVELELKTGRTHQIRVHLSYLGHPIVGDDMYGGRVFEFSDGSPRIERQALHAALLAFAHPITGEPVVCVSRPREEIVRLIRWLRQRAGAQVVHAEGTVPLVRFGLDALENT